MLPSGGQIHFDSCSTKLTSPTARVRCKQNTLQVPQSFPVIFRTDLSRMSRRSLAKKEPTVWSQCNTCGCNILSKDREQHNCSENEACPVFVKEKTLVVKHLKPYSGDLNGIDPVKLNNLLFLHESVFGLCDLILGDFVRISSSELANGAPIVRVVWPVVNQSAANGVVFVTEHGNFWDFTLIFFYFS